MQTVVIVFCAHSYNWECSARSHAMCANTTALAPAISKQKYHYDSLNMEPIQRQHFAACRNRLCETSSLEIYHLRPYPKIFAHSDSNPRQNCASSGAVLLYHDKRRSPTLRHVVNGKANCELRQSCRAPLLT